MRLMENLLLLQETGNVRLFETSLQALMVHQTELFAGQIFHGRSSAIGVGNSPQTQQLFLFCTAAKVCARCQMTIT